MAVFNDSAFDNHERVLFCRDESVGLFAIIAIHSTALGPAAGGCRLWNYDDADAAVHDVLRLSQGMSYKNAMAGLRFGGGKAVIAKTKDFTGSDELYANPAHPYTSLLLGSIPIPDPLVSLHDHAEITGELPSPMAPPSGCRFRTRCPFADEICERAEPQMRRVTDEHYVACHHPLVEIDEVEVTLN